ncbi:cholesterol 7-desaturase nvd 1 isoform X2 [Daktulosphaira vitifoliae]|nr:cholesterol 7-desaturase nvd 1 isoform X2 [Daktulosphaira vitifoliae]XP_050522724.1 cholesterol 7-desaturase nvd 1 isoform X2 [Daktulosphaira vitifoliae]XP_050522725.1 cholesterol 7-desaturase nvd 1 isoform X2 [Daktulosphaira vitifoliae]XP_050522726.1 cholesterol 7-desaturase nvd 1 isoform X2 [Daktulosphaira vitifoliae]XP_050522727.1 cholesterol 7-desaturase nvd 1 isoform X2 [Daktulosphaira vitifoliae]XP_050522728.1 cholesterol 7-desaturase nvd 1 isoform X2 [Daktulosphaira vitifoliae]XP_05
MFKSFKIITNEMSTKFASDIFEYVKNQNGITAIKSILILTAVCLIFFYGCKLVILPWNIKRTLTDVGYENILYNQWSSSERVHMIRATMKLRKNGKLPPVYPNGWFSLIESDQVKLEQVQHVTALGEHFAVLRTKNGNVNVLDAYCPHLGANMAIGGTVTGNKLQCPFHGWTFDTNSGKCIQITTNCLHNTENKIFSNVSVRKWKSCEAYGFIFVWYHAENEQPDWNPPRIDLTKLIYQGRTEHYANVHIQDVAENGADPSHFTEVHSKLIGGFYSFPKSLLNYIGVHQWASTWIPDESKRYISHVEINYNFKLLKKFNIFQLKINANQIGPGLVILKIQNIFGNIILIQTVTPVEPLIQKIVHRVYSPLHQSLFGRAILFYEKTMLERDIRIWNHKSFVEKPLITKQESMIRVYREWYKQYYSCNSRHFSFKKETMTW